LLLAIVSIILFGRAVTTLDETFSFARNADRCTTPLQMTYVRNKEFISILTVGLFHVLDLIICAIIVIPLCCGCYFCACCTGCRSCCAFCKLYRGAGMCTECWITLCYKGCCNCTVCTATCCAQCWGWCWILFPLFVIFVLVQTVVLFLFISPYILLIIFLMMCTGLAMFVMAHYLIPIFCCSLNCNAIARKESTANHSYVSMYLYEAGTVSSLG